MVVGTRTAAFAPLADRALIVVDEAHDGGYKSDRTPRYDARWVARRRAALIGARAGARDRHARRGDPGARPSAAMVERGAAASSAGWAGSPADRAGRPAGGAGRREPLDLLARADRGARRPCGAGTEQAILLMNRRGAATFILCRDCGESLRCPDCDLPFVYHLAGGAAALPPLRPDRSRRRSAARTAAATGSATSAPERSGSRRSCAPASRTCGSRGSTPTRWPRGAASRRSTTTCATAASTCWSGPSSPRRASTCRA